MSPWHKHPTECKEDTFAFVAAAAEYPARLTGDRRLEQVAETVLRNLETMLRADGGLQRRLWECAWINQTPYDPNTTAHLCHVADWCGEGQPEPLPDGYVLARPGVNGYKARSGDFGYTVVCGESYVSLCGAWVGRDALLQEAAVLVTDAGGCTYGQVALLWRRHATCFPGGFAQTARCTPPSSAPWYPTTWWCPAPRGAPGNLGCPRVRRGAPARAQGVHVHRRRAAGGGRHGEPGRRPGGDSPAMRRILYATRGEGRRGRTLLAAGVALGLMGAVAAGGVPAGATGEMVTQWLVCGPFPGTEMTSFYEDHLGELGGESQAAPVAGTTVTNPGLDGGIQAWYGKSTWREQRTADDGYVDFHALYADTAAHAFTVTRKVAYAFTTVHSPAGRRVLFEVRTNDALQVWVNHREVHYNHLFRGGWRRGGVDLVVVDLLAGPNAVMVKVGDYRYQNEWGVALRVRPVADRIYPNVADVLLPNLRAGEPLEGWASISLVNTAPQRLDSVTVEVVGSDLFAPQVTQAPPLEPEWDSRVAFRVVTRRAVTASDSGRAVLSLVVRQGDQAHRLSLAPEVRKPEQSYTRTYLSEVDGSVQPYSLLVPATYDGTRRLPLLVVLHGAHVKECIDAFQPKDWAVVMTAYGRGNTGYREIGTNDVFRAMEAAEAELRIDPDRVYLAGHSMGGHGTWYLGTHYPDRWAALNPMSGYGDYRVGGYSDADVPRWQIPLLVGRSAIFTVQNLLHLPAFVVHGAQDDDVTVEQARRMSAALRELGYTVVYDEHADQGHWWGMDFANAQDFLRAQVKDPAPREVVLRTNRLQCNRAYWVRLDAIERVPELARIRAVASPGNHIAVEAENVLRFTLFADERLVERGQPVSVTTNGQVSFAGSADAFPLSLERDAEGAYRVTTGASGATEKSEKVFGPLIDAYSSPFIYVYGSVGMPAETQANQRAARQDALDWRTWANGNAQIRRDTEVTEADVRAKNLILYGGPASNAITARIAAQLPIRLERGTVRVGPRAYSGPDLGLRMVYPNPLNPERYVLVNAGSTPQVTDWLRNVGDPLYDPLPDYVVFRRSDLERHRDDVLEAGFFDRDWAVPGTGP